MNNIIKHLILIFMILLANNAWAKLGIEQNDKYITVVNNSPNDLRIQFIYNLVKFTPQYLEVGANGSSQVGLVYSDMVGRSGDEIIIGQIMELSCYFSLTTTCGLVNGKCTNPGELTLKEDDTQCGHRLKLNLTASGVNNTLTIDPITSPPNN